MIEQTRFLSTVFLCSEFKPRKGFWFVISSIFIRFDLKHCEPTGLRLNTPECDLCQKQKPSPFYNWVVPLAAKVTTENKGTSTDHWC